jgi:protoporphyrinogen oxidase
VIAKKLALAGAGIYMSDSVIGIAREQNIWRVSCKSGTVFEADELISTMPLTLLARTLGGPRNVLEAAEKLRFRNTIIVYLKVERQHLFEDQWLYVQSDNLRTGRITNFSNWGTKRNENQKFTILALEYWCFDEDEIWMASDETLIAQAKGDLKESGVAESSEVSEGFILRVSKCYPVYDYGYQKNLEVVQKFVDSWTGLSAIGRYGSFKYNNQDHSILMGLLAAENITSDSQHDLWGVNADDEYQEASLISDTGLVVKEG